MQQVVIKLEPSQELLDAFRTICRTELANYIPPAPPVTELPQFSTRKQASETLGVSYTTLNEWGKDKLDRPAILVPYKINGRVRYKREDILAALKEKRRFKEC